MGQSFNPGDVVKLKSGGPRMTVQHEGGNGVLVCKWFVGTDLKEGIFAPEALDPAEKPASSGSAVVR